MVCCSSENAETGRNEGESRMTKENLVAIIAVGGWIFILSFVPVVGSLIDLMELLR
jgi:hypothetical protein